MHIHSPLYKRGNKNNMTVIKYMVYDIDNKYTSPILKTYQKKGAKTVIKKKNEHLRTP